MIVIDSSALVAIMLDEPDRDVFQRILTRATDLRMSTVNVYETTCVLRARRGQSAIDRCWHFIGRIGIGIMAFDELQARAAEAAYARYGKGLGSKAQLNLCDCAAYALARTLDAPLLFKGEDFPHTDVARCV